MSLKILSLYIRYGTDKYTHGYDDLSHYYATCLPKTKVQRVIIDNAQHTDSYQKEADGTLIIGGDNKFWEFSGWDHAIDFLRDKIVHYDYVHLVTSAYNQLYTAYINRISQPMLELMRNRDVAIGHIDAYNEPIEFLHCISQAWIRSSFVFLPPATLMRLGKITSVGAEGRDAWFSGTPAAPFSDAAPISKLMQSNIINWLTGEGTGQNTVWHSRFDLNEKSLPFFQAKSLAILNEHALSLSILAQGSSLVDPSWLAAAMKGADNTSMSAFNNWREQLKQRAPYL